MTAPTARHVTPPQAADTGIDAALALARATAEQVARRKAEQAEAWAKHLGDAMAVVEEAGVLRRQVMTWLWAAALLLAVAVLVASRVRGRGEFPFDPEFDLDGEGPQ